jgi:hypothetical protein
MRGHWFNVHRRKDKTVDYVLVRDAVALGLALREASDRAEHERLFEPPPAALNAALHDWEAA